jgi:hypothetical protein
VTIHAEGPGGVKGLVVPRHTLEGNAKSGAVGLHEMNKARAEVYGSEHREPLTIGKIGEAHKKTLAEHFDKPEHEQVEAEKAALERTAQSQALGQGRRHAGRVREAGHRAPRALTKRAAPMWAMHRKVWQAMPCTPLATAKTPSTM